MSSPQPHSDREIEVKLAVPNGEAAHELLLRAGFAALHERAFESNEVYDTPAGELLLGRQLLRLRDFRNEAILTFKGPPEPGPHKSRPEFETRLESASALRQILHALGYRLTFRYEKFRTTFQRSGEPGHAVLDETPIGTFLELEGPPDWIDSTAQELGFTRESYILLSYGSLYRDYCQRAGIEPTHMVYQR